MKEIVPGLHPDRLIRLMRDAVERCQLKLDGLTVLTEAATGAYVVTPVLAAMAGAGQVYAIAKDSRFGSAAHARELTCELATKLGVERRITFVDRWTQEVLGAADIITNSGHVRPITAAVISQMKQTAVIPLMYENWEFRASDVDLAACRNRGIRVGGTNERHPAVGVFEFLGILAVKLLADAGVCGFGGRIVLVCDNDFGPYIEKSLRSIGAEVQACQDIPAMLEAADAVLVAKMPREDSVLSVEEIRTIARRSPGAVIAQYFGDLDRDTIATLGIPMWPEASPDKGHMGILLSAVGPEPIVRLQAGGLKAGQVLHANGNEKSDWMDSFVQLM